MKKLAIDIRSTDANNDIRVQERVFRIQSSVTTCTSLVCEVTLHNIEESPLWRLYFLNRLSEFDRMESAKKKWGHLVFGSYLHFRMINMNNASETSATVQRPQVKLKMQKTLIRPLYIYLICIPLFLTCAGTCFSFFVYCAIGGELFE